MHSLIALLISNGLASQSNQREDTKTLAGIKREYSTQMISDQTRQCVGDEHLKTTHQVEEPIGRAL